MYVLRGNHELRGRHASAWMDYNDLPEGLPYRTASWGKFFLIFLDTLEDKPDSDIEYGGTMLSEPYLKAQAEWLEKVVESDGCRKAAVRLVFAHIPPDRNGWQGDRNVEEYFVPILNKAGITAMFCGHLHQWRIDNPGQRSSANFPVVINPNCRRMEVTASPEGLSLKVFDLDGAQTQSWSCPARRSPATSASLRHNRTAAQQYCNTVKPRNNAAQNRVVSRKDARPAPSALPAAVSRQRRARCSGRSPTARRHCPQPAR